MKILQQGIPQTHSKFYHVSGTVYDSEDTVKIFKDILLWDPQGPYSEIWKDVFSPVLVKQWEEISGILKRRILPGVGEWSSFDIKGLFYQN